MCECVVADLVAFVVDPSRNAGILVSLYSDQKESAFHILCFEYVKNLRRELRIRTIIEGDRDLVRGGAVQFNAIRSGQTLHGLAGDEAGLGLDSADGALPG